MVVKQGSSFVETASVRRLAETKFLAVEMMAKLMAKGAQKRAKRGHLFTHSRAGPDTDTGIAKGVIPEKLSLPSTFAHAEGTRRQSADFGRVDAVKGCGQAEEFGACSRDLRAGAFVHYLLNDLRQPGESWIGGQCKGYKPLALAELLEQPGVTG